MIDFENLQLTNSLNQLCETFQFPKRERSLIFSLLKKSCFPKLVLQINFLIQ